MVDPKLMEAWHRMMAETMRSASGTQDFMNALTGAQEGASAKHPAAWFAQWMKQQDLPGAPAEVPDDPSEEWIEQWYRSMGMVPRKRYLDLLARYDTLRRKLEEARERIERLEKARGTTQPERATEEVMDVWKSSLDETLRTQREWMQSFLKKQQYLDAPDDNGASSSS